MLGSLGSCPEHPERRWVVQCLEPAATSVRARLAQGCPVIVVDPLAQRCTCLADVEHHLVREPESGEALTKHLGSRPLAF